MTEKKPRLFFYDKREMRLLVLAGLLLAAFSFTLGVHFGSRLTPSAADPHLAEAEKAGTQEDVVPGRVDLVEQGRGAQVGADQALNQAIQEEVANTGIHLDKARQVNLPKETKSKEAGATTHSDATSHKGEEEHQKNEPGDPSAEAKSETKYTLQVGSYPTRMDAEKRVDLLAEKGEKPFIREAEISGRGSVFRVYLGAFPSVKDAEKIGRELAKRRVIDSYVVANRPE